jgi:hypothetical protein
MSVSRNKEERDVQGVGITLPPGTGVLTVDRQGLLRLIDEEAKQLGLSANEALEIIQRGEDGDNFVWSDISLLSDLLEHAT